MTGPYSDPGDWEPGIPKVYVSMARNMEIRGFLLSGDDYTLNRANHSLLAIHARDVDNVVIDDCEVFNFHDGICFEARQRFDHTLGLIQETVSGEVKNSLLHDFFPVAADPLDPQNKGHAAIWVVREGEQVVDVVAVEIYEAHDALEIEGVQFDSFATAAILDVSGCNIHDLENAVEVVGKGSLTFSVLGSQFRRCINQPGGIPVSSKSQAAIAVRSMDQVVGTVRDSVFEDNGYGVLFGMEPSAESFIDLGRECDPGGNTFLPFNFDPPPATEDYRVHVFLQSPDSPAAFDPEIRCYGNTWIPGQQLADPVTGEMLFVATVLGPENVPNLPTGDGPPGPQVGEFQSPGVPWNRNYSIRTANGFIQFGVDCP